MEVSTQTKYTSKLTIQLHFLKPQRYYSFWGLVPELPLEISSALGVSLNTNLAAFR